MARSTRTFSIFRKCELNLVFYTPSTHRTFNFRKKYSENETIVATTPQKR
jgi:hypothetical protein